MRSNPARRLRTVSHRSLVAALCIAAPALHAQTAGSALMPAVRLYAADVTRYQALAKAIGLEPQ